MTVRARLGALPKGTPRVPPAASASAFYQFVEVNGVLFPQEEILNLIAGNGISLLGADDPGNNRTNVTITSLFCDNVVAVLADLPAPVAGVISLTSGSWCFVNDIDLGANSLVVPAGVTVFLTSEGKRLTSTHATATLDVQTATSLCTAEGLHFRNTGAGFGVRSVNGGTFYNRFELCMFEATIAFEQLAGGVIIDTSQVIGSTDGIRMNDNAGRVVVTSSVFTNAATRHINAEIGFSLQVIGCYFSNAATAIEFDGDPDHAVVSGCEFDSLTTGIRVLAGMQDCRVVGNSFSLCATIGITMAVAAVPAGGFSMVGNSFDLNGADYGPFTHLTARVNSKANVSSASPSILTPLLPETPIVP